MNKEFYTVEELSQILRVSELSIKRWIRAGKLKAHKEVVDGRKKWVILEKGIAEYLKNIKKED